MENEQLLTQGKIFEDEILAGAKGTAKPAEEVSEPHDHAKNLTGTLVIELIVKSLILRMYDVLTRDKSGLPCCSGTTIQPIGSGKASGGSEVFDLSRGKLWRWAWPLGIAAAGVGTAAMVLLRGCWHTHMSWPTRYDDHYSYRVCTDCGIKRLFDPKSFRGYGPYNYDLHELIARDRARRMKQQKITA